MGLFKAGIVGIEEVLEDATGHEEELPLSQCGSKRFALPAAPSLLHPPRFFP